MRHYYGQFTHAGQGYSLEGDDSDCLYVHRLTSPSSAEPVCVITGRDRNHSWEILGDLAEPERTELVRAAVRAYRMWIADH